MRSAGNAHLHLTDALGLQLEGARLRNVTPVDRMSNSAGTIWLDALEHLPPRTVIVFTTNAPEKLTRRLRDRCECYHFTCDSDELRPAIQTFARSIWEVEVPGAAFPDFDELGMPTLGDLESMHASFRLALHQLEKIIRSARAGRMNGVSQVRKDSIVFSEADWRVSLLPQENEGQDRRRDRQMQEMRQGVRAGFDGSVTRPRPAPLGAGFFPEK